MDKTNKLSFEVEYLPGITLFSAERAYITWDATDTITLYTIDKATNQYSQIVFSVHISQLTGFRIEWTTIMFLSLFVGGKKYIVKVFDGNNATASALDGIGLGDMVRDAVGSSNTGEQNLLLFISMLNEAGVKKFTFAKLYIIGFFATIALIMIIVFLVIFLSDRNQS
ncbi:hypothetical protein KC952_00385 [Candidatus Saccharibacteria bacterium]|nr:hypothetical protein [Candidatus Saccharibacteria bacterium]